MVLVVMVLVLGVVVVLLVQLLTHSRCTTIFGCEGATPIAVPERRPVLPLPFLPPLPPCPPLLRVVGWRL